MLGFSYIVKDANGKTSHGISNAADQEALITQLQRQGFFIVSIEPLLKDAAEKYVQGTPRRNPFTHTKITPEDTILFARQLSTMLEAGVNLIRSLNVILLQVESRKFHAVLSAVLADVEHGLPLSAALAKHPRIFDVFWVSICEVGEASGTVPVVLNRLAFYIERAERFRQSIIGAVIYPCLLIVASIGAVIFFAFFVGPKFTSLYKTFNAPLPAITQAMLLAFEFVKNKIFLLTGILCAIVILARRYFKTPPGQVQMEAFLFNLPVFGPVIKTVVVEKFTSQMSILVDSGVPIMYALDIVERMMGNRICEGHIKKMKERVREGKLISEEMTSTSFFPPMAAQMIAIGEETGELGKMLSYVSRFYQETVQTFMSRFSTLFEPFMLIFIGAIIGTMLVAMFLPIFSMATMGR